jgi:hypothetical protein
VKGLRTREGQDAYRLVHLGGERANWKSTLGAPIGWTSLEQPGLVLGLRFVSLVCTTSSGMVLGIYKTFGDPVETVIYWLN